MINKDQKTIYFHFFNEIAPEIVQFFTNVLAGINQQHKPDRIYIMFSSPGGNVGAGITLYNFLKALPCEIVMHNTGSIDSIATVIFLAGDQRYASPHSSFLFHGVNTTFLGNTSCTLGQIREFQTSLERDQEKIAGIVTDNTKIEDTEIKELFTQGESKDTSFALEKGIISEIVVPTIPKNEIFINITGNRK